MCSSVAERAVGGAAGGAAGLAFTGNWFIDAGILGFVNLMEEVYGDAWIKEWKDSHSSDGDIDFLVVLQDKIKREPEKVYYGYFPMAYVFYNNKVREVENTIPPNKEVIPDTTDKKEIFENVWKWIISKYGIYKNSKYKVDLIASNMFYYFKNFLFFQPSWDSSQQKNAFMELLGLGEIEEEVLRKIDKTIDKFLPSKKEFSNIPYGSAFLDYRNINYIFVLCFPFSFNKEIGRRLFYSDDLSFTYKVNKRLGIYAKAYGGKSGIFNITWKAVLDVIVELESSWNLEEMYIIKYNLKTNQEIFDVEFIGLSKLQANIILDDTIRNSLNTSIPTRKVKTNQNDWKWILEEFIENNTLYPLILGHANLAINGKTKLYKSAAIYSLAVEYTTIPEKSDNFVFSDFFKKQTGLKELPNRIKNNASKMFGAASLSSKLFRSEVSVNKNFVLGLFIPIKRGSKKDFVNVLLKHLAGKNMKDVSKMLSYVFEDILKKENWGYWALPIVMGLIGGNGNE